MRQQISRHKKAIDNVVKTWKLMAEKAVKIDDLGFWAPYDIMFGVNELKSRVSEILDGDNTDNTSKFLLAQCDDGNDEQQCLVSNASSGYLLEDPNR